MSAGYVLKQTRAKALLEKALLDSIVENPIPCGLGKTELVNRLNTLQRKSKIRLQRKSSGITFKKETIHRRYSSLTAVTGVKPRGEVIAASEEIPCWNKFTGVPDGDELSLENLSCGRKSTKLRNAGSRLSFNKAPSVANLGFNEKKRSTVPCWSQPSIMGTFNESLQLIHSEIAQKSGKLQLDYKPTATSVDIVEVPDKPANIGQGDENSDYYSSSPKMTASDSEISDWQDQFSFPEDLEFNAAKSSLDSIDSSSYSLGTQCNRSPSRTLKPMYKRTTKAKDLPPAGMIFVGWLNSKTGSRFKNFQLDAKLQTVIDWLGNPLPIVIQEPGRGTRRCDSDSTLARALGKMLKSPSQQGIAFFVGPVNSKLSYLITIVDLDELCAIKAGEDKELEKVKSWL